MVQAPMLRALVLLLVLLNGVFYAWAQGWLAPWGFSGAPQTEPQRLAQQLRPEALRILGPASAASAPGPAADAASGTAAAAPAAAGGASAAAPTVCLQAGVFDAAQAERLRAALQTALPAGGWHFEPAVEGARWIVYMGRYADAQAVARKRAELRALNIGAEAPRNPQLEPGLSLGAYPSEAAARAALDQFASRGVRTARVALEQAERPGQQLRIDALDASQRGAVQQALAPALAGKALTPCNGG